MRLTWGLPWNLSCLGQLKNILLNLLCVFDLFSECWQSTLFQIFFFLSSLVERKKKSTKCLSMWCFLLLLLLYFFCFLFLITSCWVRVVSFPSQSLCPFPAVELKAELDKFSQAKGLYPENTKTDAFDTVGTCWRWTQWN